MLLAKRSNGDTVGLHLSSAMELRRHPILVCDGVMTWPPKKWLQTYGPNSHIVSGEVGVLDAVFLSQVSINKVYLMTKCDEDCYMGILMFESASAAKALFTFLQSQIGKPLQTIASTDLPSDFGAQKNGS